MSSSNRTSSVGADAHSLFIKSEVSDNNLNASFPPLNTTNEAMTTINEHVAYLVKLRNGVLVETLECAVAKSKLLVRQLWDKLKATSADTAETKHWKTQLRSLLDSSTHCRAIIGVVGSTGAGKSSVINALLDEERLIPTNCMRACTAVPIEIRWNESNDPDSLYRAEVEFMSHEEFKTEISILLEDLVGPDGQISKDSSNPDTQAGVAYAKLRALWPHMTKEAMAKKPLQECLNDTEIAKYLGQVKEFVARVCATLYSQLQKYVDSVENEGERLDADIKKTFQKMEYWPLIRVVRLYVKAKALSTGAVLVDLPGFHDANAARAAVAERYIKDCTGLFVVAPINRAVDDKTAKDLLGSRFKRQMQYDGTYSNITFVCSKTDDISAPETVETLHLQDQMKDFRLEGQELEKEKAELEGNEVEVVNKIDQSDRAIRDLNHNINEWTVLESRLRLGQKVFAPRAKKRKCQQKPSKQRRTRRYNLSKAFDLSESEDSDSDDDDDDIDEDDIYDEELAAGQGRDTLNAVKISSELAEFRKQLDDTLARKSSLSRQLKTIKKRKKQISRRFKEIRCETTSICISERNEYSKEVIQRDFATGVEELDQQNQEMENPDTFDPHEKTQRDYNEVRRSLPVFCVSARAYQKLRGRLQEEFSLPSFTNIEQTEIPELQDHCTRITAKGRASAACASLSKQNAMLNSLWLWASESCNDGTLSTEQVQEQLEFTGKLSKILEQDFKTNHAECLAKIEQILHRNIYRDFQSGAKFAKSGAKETADSWSNGVRWNTYRAICRNGGSFKGVDWNQHL